MLFRNIGDFIIWITEWGAKLVFLNLLWLVFSLPIVTVFASTTATYAVMRQWIFQQNTGSSLFGIFLSYFKENWKQGTGLGIIFSIIGIIVYVDYIFVLTMDNPIFTTVFILIFYLFVVTLLLSFAVIVHYESSVFQSIRNAFVFAIAYPLCSFFLVISVLSLVMMFLMMPGLLPFFSISGIALLTNIIINPIFRKIGV